MVVTLGTVSEGTLRSKDLLPKFADVLEGLDPKDPLLQEAREVDPMSDEASYILDDLFDALNRFAPPFCSFGAHPGDGSDFGFWLDHDLLEEALRFPDRVVGEWTYLEGDNIWVQVNDHGNVMIADADTGEVLVEAV